MNLGEVKAQFKGLLNNNVVNGNAALVSTFINQGIMRIQRELRVPFMEKQILFTIPSDYKNLAIPDDLLELISIQVDRDNDGIQEYELQRVDMNRVAYASQYPGKSTVFARQAGAWILGPRPPVGDKVLITYYAEFEPLTDDTTSNVLTIIGWDLIVYAALSAATAYLTDDRKAGFEQDYLRIAKSLQDQADADELTADAAVRPALHYDEDC